MTAQTGLEDGSSSRVVIQACGSDQRGPGPKCRRNLRTAVERRRRPYPSTQPPWRTLPRPSERLVQREGRSRLAEVSRLSRRRSIASCAPAEPATRRAWTGRREALRGSPRVTLLLKRPSTPSIRSPREPLGDLGVEGALALVLQVVDGKAGDDRVEGAEVGQPQGHVVEEELDPLLAREALARGREHRL